MREFVICIDNKGNPASLIVGKVYQRLPDEKGEALKLIRVVDEDTSELDGYLYPSAMFVPIELPLVAEQALLAAS